MAIKSDPSGPLEGFTVQLDGREGSVGILGGHIKSCRLLCDNNYDKYFVLMQVGVAENCLIVAGYFGHDNELLSDSILRSCTVYTGSQICDSEMENTIVYARRGSVYLEGLGVAPLSKCVFFGVKGVAGRAGVTISDPQFADAANGDFRLKKGSPCIDKGGTAYGETDLARNPRVVNGTVDVGCYEYQENAGTVDADNVVPAKGWPSWVLGTWTGAVVNVVPEDDGTLVYKGSYELTLTSTGLHEKYVFDDGEIVESDNDNRGWKIVESRDCHVIATCWCWNGEMDDKFDATYVFRDASCKCGDGKSSFKMLLREGGDTVEGTLTKLDVANPDVPELADSYGPFVPGERIEIEIPGLAGYTAKGLPSGLKLNKKTGEITGAAKKPTGEAGVTVTFTKKNEPTLTAQFVVGPMPTINVTLEGDTEKCKVTGAGSWLVGKKVSLSATAPKGTAFVGWTLNGEPWPSVEESKKTKLSYVMTKESISLVATFEKEKMRVACPALASASFTVGVTGAAAGVPIEIETQSGIKSVAVSKLPSGMKYDKKTGLIVGAPTKAGSFDVTIKVTAKSGAVETLVVPVNVASLPDWATGTFGGMIGRFVGPIDNDEFRPYGMITMKITAAGKISAKVMAGGKTYSFSAKGFDFVDEDGDYHFRMATKKGEVYEGEISATYHDVAQLVKVDDADVQEGSFTIVGHEPYFAVVWRNEHGKDGRLSGDPTGRAQKVMDAIKDFKTVELAQFDSAYGSVVLKIDAKGTTKLSGKTADGVKISGTSFLMLDDDWYHVISDMVFYDKQSGNVYDVTPCFQPVFDCSGNVVDWDWKCCDHSLRVYPFE